MLFKKENTEAEKEFRNLYAMELVRIPRLAHTLTWWCAGLFLLLILSTCLPWTQNISTQGKLTSLNPQDRPQTIHATIAGRIEEWQIQEGQEIKKGDTILRLSETKEKYFDPELLERMNEQILSKESALKATIEKSKALNNQIQALTMGLNVSLSKAKNKVVQASLKVKSDSIDLIAIKTDNEIAALQLERQQKLYDQGLKSLTELEQRKLKFQESTAKLAVAKNKLDVSKNEWMNAQIELTSLKAEYIDKISKAESELNSTQSYIYNSEAEISKMNNEYSNTLIRSGFYYITAPQDGYLVKALKQGLGETVKEGEPVASIVARNPNLAVELYVKPMDVPLLSKGSKIRLQFDGWPAMVFSGWPDASFGTFGGVIAVIDNIDSEGKYRILVVPDPAEDPWPKPLRVGSGAYGWAMLKDVPIFYEIWRQLNGFPADYFNPTEKSKSNDDDKY